MTCCAIDPKRRNKAERAFAARDLAGVALGDVGGLSKRGRGELFHAQIVRTFRTFAQAEKFAQC